MKDGWQSKSFEDCIEKVTYTSKIQRKDFLAVGDYPVISQEESFINGYWDNEDDVFQITNPVVLFGDHTKVLKYVDFDFVLGADGVKVLPPKEFLVPKFFYYQLQTAQLDSLGYARHYKLLKELEIKYPGVAEQQRIVAILDAAFAEIATAKAKAEKNLQNARTLFDCQLEGVFSLLLERCTETTLAACCEQIFAGGDVPNGRCSKERTEIYSVPIYANGIKDHGLYGFTDVARVTKPSVTVSARGTIGFAAIRTEPFLPVVRLIVLVPNEAVIDLEYMHYAIQRIDFGNTGTSIPQLTVPNFKDRKLPLPSLAEQREIATGLNILLEKTQRLESIYQQKLAALDELKKSLLHQAFSGAL